MCFMAVTVLVDLASVASLRNPSAMARGYGRDRPVNPLTIYLTPQFIPAGTLSAEADTTSEVRVESYDKASGSGSSGRASPSNRFFGSVSSSSPPLSFASSSSSSSSSSLPSSSLPSSSLPSSSPPPVVSISGSSSSSSSSSSSASSNLPLFGSSSGSSASSSLPPSSG